MDVSSFDEEEGESSLSQQQHEAASDDVERGEQQAPDTHATTTRTLALHQRPRRNANVAAMEEGKERGDESTTPDAVTAQDFTFLESLTDPIARVSLFTICNMHVSAYLRASHFGYFYQFFREINLTTADSIFTDVMFQLGENVTVSACNA